MIELLVVDSDSDFQALIAARLEVEAPKTYVLRFAEAVGEALVELERARVDLILLDLSLPDGSGLATFATLAERAVSVPIVVLSGDHDEDLALKAVQLGAQDYIVKDQLRHSVLSRSLRYAIERKRAQENLRRQQSQLVYAARMTSLGEMAAGIAHEVRNPLTVIQAHVQQLRSSLGNEVIDRERLSATANNIDTVVHRISVIIDGMLAFARDDKSTELKVANLTELVGDGLSLCRARLEKHDVKVTTSFPAHAVPLLCNPTQIVQVILNLLSNAHAAVQAVTVRRIDIAVVIDGDATILAVTDTGSGVPSQIRDRIFQPFFTTRRVGEGTGLGLSISKGIVEAHGGTLLLDLDSPATRFVLRLPLEGN